MKRTILLLTVMATMVVAYAGLALAQTSTAETLDANSLGLGESVNAYTAVGEQKSVQTFTAEHNGQLTTAKLKIHLDSAWGSIDGAKVQITTVDPATGLPTSNVLASSTIPSSDIPLLPANINPASIPMTTVTFGSPATVEAGKPYAIVLDTIASNTNLHFLRWTTILQDYSGGQGMWINDDGSFAGFLPARPERDNVSDQVFAIYVTIPDTNAPTVDAVSPDKGTKDVVRGTSLTATFSERMDPDSVSTTTFKLYKVNADGSVRQLANAPVTLSADGLSAKLDPFGASTTRLLPNTKYKAVVTTGAEDLAGNALDQNATKEGNQPMKWTFTTR